MSARSALLDGREVRRHRRLLGAGARRGDGPVRLLLAVALASALAAGCRSPRPAAIPAGMAAVSAPAPGELATLVWVGQGQAERFEGGTWRRAPEFDYEFSVEQHRYADRWESVKTMRRRHPGYDGSAGPRVQTYLFRLELTAGANPTEVDYQISSSLGKGRGRGDREFRKAVLELDADVSMFAPFDRYRITQDYQYEEGKLVELVELNDGASPWVRNREVALLFGATSYPAPPTRLGAAGTAADVEASDNQRPAHRRARRPGASSQSHRLGARPRQGDADGAGPPDCRAERSEQTSGDQESEVDAAWPQHGPPGRWQQLPERAHDWC